MARGQTYTATGSRVSGRQGYYGPSAHDNRVTKERLAKEAEARRVAAAKAKSDAAAKAKADAAAPVPVGPAPATFEAPAANPVQQQPVEALQSNIQSPTTFGQKEAAAIRQETWDKYNNRVISGPSQQSAQQSAPRAPEVRGKTYTASGGGSARDGNFSASNTYSTIFASDTKAGKIQKAKEEEWRAGRESEYAGQLAQVEQDGWKVNNIPVKLSEETGRLVYDTKQIGEWLGVSPEDVDKYTGIEFGEHADTGKAQSDARQGNFFTDNSKAGDAFMGSKLDVKAGGKNAAILNNLSAIDPLKSQVDFQNEDHAINLTKPGFMQSVGEAYQGDRLGQGQGPKGLHKTIGSVLRAGVGGLLGFASGPFAPLTMAAYGAATGIADGEQGLGDILKNAAVGGATSALGGVAKGVGTGLTSGIGGTAGEIAGSVGSNLIKAGGGELLSMAKDGDFDWKSAAIGAGTGIATDAALDLAQPLTDKLKGSLGMDVTPNVTAPVPTDELGNELGMADRIGQGFTEAGANVLGGFGFDNLAAEMRGTTVQDDFEGINADIGVPTNTDIQSDFTGINAEISDATDTSTQGDFAGISADVGIPTGTSVQNDFAGINADIGVPTDTSVQSDWQGINQDIGVPTNTSVQSDFAGINADIGVPTDTSVQSDWEGINADIDAATDTSVQSDWEGINADIDAATDTSVQSDWEGITDDIDNTSPAITPGPTGNYGELSDAMMEAIGPVLSNIGPEDQDQEPERTPTSSPMLSQLSSAGATDRISQKQSLATGYSQTNPSLMSGLGASIEESDEERKKREMLWMGNPVIG